MRSDDAGSMRRITVASLVAGILAVGSLAEAGDSDAASGCGSKALRAMARVKMARGDYSAAEPLAQRALIAARLSPDNEEELASCYLDAAYLYLNQGRFAEAEDMCLLGLAVQEQVYYAEHPYIGYTLRILGDIYQNRGKYEEAQASLERAMDIMVKVHRDDDCVLAPFLADMAGLRAAQGEYAEAERGYKEAIDILDEDYGPGHLYTAGVQAELAGLYAMQGRFEDAQRLVDAAGQVQEKTYGPEHYLMARTWLTKAVICRGQSNCDKAETLAKKALSAVEESLGTGHPLAGEIHCVLGEFYTEDQRYEDAEYAFRRAVGIYTSCVGEDNDSTAGAMNGLARVLIRRGRLDEAEQLCIRALVILDGIFEADHPRVAAVYKTMGELQARLSVWEGFADAWPLRQ